MGGFRGEHAWAVLAAGIIGYEIACNDNELLSVAVDRWLVSRPVLTRLVIAAVALHLLNALPAYADPLGKRLWSKIFRTVRGPGQFIRGMCCDGSARPLDGEG